jgi:hypothetical protein
VPKCLTKHYLVTCDLKYKWLAQNPLLFMRPLDSFSFILLLVLEFVVLYLYVGIFGIESDDGCVLFCVVLLLEDVWMVS